MRLDYVPRQTNTAALMFGVIAMAIVVAASNFLVTSPVSTVFGIDVNAATGLPVSEYVQWAALTYPIAFLVTDVMNRAFGASAARKVIFVGFLVGVALSWYLSLPRIAMASGVAFLVAQLLDVTIFNRLRDGVWWKAPLVSSVIGGTVDSLIFWPGAFSDAPQLLAYLPPGDFPGWQNYAVVDWAVKMAVTLFMLVPFRLATFSLGKARPPLR